MQKTKQRTDHNRHIENLYECPRCKTWVSGRDSWIQRNLQHHYGCLNRCGAKTNHECQYRQKERGDLCDSPYRCQHKYNGTRNQCDGCKAKMPLSEGIHMLKGNAHMVCQKHLYQ